MNYNIKYLKSTIVVGLKTILVTSNGIMRSHNTCIIYSQRNKNISCVHAVIV